MSQEKFGIHISLIDNGREQDGIPVLDITVDSNMNSEDIENIMWGLLEQYDQMNSDDK